jgi:tetratricopeptide (TPR) repeat protein
VSGDFRYAEELLLSAETNLKRDVQHGAGAVVSVLLDRVRRRIAELYAEWIARLMHSFIQKRDRSLLVQADQLLPKLRAYQRDSYGVHLAAAQIAFELRRDIQTARAEIDACRDVNDAAWQYSDAFLLAYDGDLQSAYRSYRRAFESQLGDASIPTQCEEFIITVVNEEPDRHWLYFCLGLINYRAKADLTSARRDFQRFLTRAEPARFARQIEATQKWLDEIDTELGPEDESAGAALA